MNESPPIVPTVGEIARRHGVHLHQVEHVIRARLITPIGKAGNAYIYSDSDVAYIGHELRRIAREREVGRE